MTSHPATSHPAALNLPDCRVARSWSLSRAQRDAVIRVLAEKGPAGLEAWLREEEKRDPRIRARLQEERERLEREARARKAAALARQQGERDGLTHSWEARMREQAAREAELRRKLDALHASAGGPGLAGRLMDLAPVLAQATAPPKPGFAARLAGWLTALWVWLVYAWTWLVRKLRGLPAPRRTVMAGGVALDLVPLARSHPELFARLKVKPGARFGERLLGREDYAETVQRLMDEDAAAARAKADLDVSAQEDELVRELERSRSANAAQAKQRQREQEELEAAQRRELADVEAAADLGAYRALQDSVLGDLREGGLVDERGKATHLLLERFADLVAADELGALAATGQATPGTYAGGEGEYERGPLRSHFELGAMDLVESIVQARTRHPHVRHLFDDDAVVHRELRATRAHVVVILDTSGSMEEHGRLEAAKRVALVLHRAVRTRHRDARIDLVQMETTAHRVDLAAFWDAQPRGFTNVGGALREARRLLEDGQADRKLVYLVTDGLPEALTLPDGTDKADNPKACMPYALQEARKLARLGSVRLVVYQLESKDAKFVEASREVAAAARGRVQALEPAELLRSLVVDYEAATATD